MSYYSSSLGIRARMEYQSRVSINERLPTKMVRRCLEVRRGRHWVTNCWAYFSWESWLRVAVRDYWVLGREKGELAAVIRLGKVLGSLQITSYKRSLSSYDAILSNALS
jgi:hypothetical protein